MKPAGGAVQPSWNELIRWERDQRGDLQPRVVDDLSPFFKTNPEVYISINGKSPIVEKVEQPIATSQVEQQRADGGQKEQWDRQEREKSRLWAGWGPLSGSDLWVGVYHIPEGCRYFDPNEKEALLDSISIPAPVTRDKGPNNGISVGDSKIFDTFALRQKLAATASQLASVSPFSQAQITAQYGSFQGITRDTSYLAAQLTTSPTPSIVTTASGLANSAVTTTNQPNTSNVSVTTSCPPGYYPSLPASGSATVSCTPVTGPAGSTGLSAGQTTTTTNPLTNQTVTTVTQPTTQVQSTMPSLQGTVPAAPTLTPLTPPSNVGVSASEMLNEQTQLSSEVTTLQTLLQGAASDQLLLNNQRATGVRAQTTIGFPISIETPRQLKGAVAEFRVLVLPLRRILTSQPVSIVNLLPSEKTYNVARVTSKANQFGLGVATQPISLGISTGKSKDRLYLAKDADTLAFEYPPAGYAEAPRSWFESLFSRDNENEGDCGGLPQPVATALASGPDTYDVNSAVMFGWQFRPVLGAPAVAPGRRTVFAQLALPGADGFKFEAEVWIQTRWRHYDQNKQLADKVYVNRCHWKKVPASLTFDNPVVVKDVQVTDPGQGLLRFRAKGDFFSSTGQMRSGSLNVSPAYFDGYSLEYFGAAKDILSNGDVELIDEALHSHSLVIPTKAGAKCQITDPKVLAIPQADGNSVVQLDYDRPNYKIKRKDDGSPLDGQQHPLLLIGTDVYGLRDKPLQAADPLEPGKLVKADEACKTIEDKSTTHCAFTFIASTDAIRSARTFLVRDPAWDSQGVSGTIEIDPAFTKIEASDKPAKGDDSSDSDSDEKQVSGCPKPPLKCPKPKAPAKPSWFLLSGTNLFLLKNAQFIETVVLPESNSEGSHPASPKRGNSDTDSKPQASRSKTNNPGGNSANTESISENARRTQPPNLTVPLECKDADHGCVQIIAAGKDGNPMPLTKADVRVVSDTNVWMWLTEPVGVHVFWSRPGRPASEWDLRIKEEKTAISADPAVLYETDSRAVTFTGADFSKVTVVMFEDKKLDLVVPATKAKLVVQVTSAVTAKFGHKELLAQTVDDKGKPKTIPLPLDVVKH
jgi:hypothetical protein